MEKREGQHSPGVYNSNAIMVHLVKRYAPTSDWLPDNPVTAAAVQRWLSIAAGEVCYGPAMARGALQWNVPGDPVLAAEIAGRLLGFIEQHLSDRDWLAASHITLADLACYSYVAHAPEGSIPLEPYPCVRRWLARVEAQPWFKANAGIAASRRRVRLSYLALDSEPLPSQNSKPPQTAQADPGSGCPTSLCR